MLFIAQGRPIWTCGFGRYKEGGRIIRQAGDKLSFAEVHRKILFDTSAEAHCCESDGFALFGTTL